MAVVNKLTPPSRTGHVAVAYEKYMLVWGGYKHGVLSQDNADGTDNTYFSGSELWIYSSDSEKWYLKKCSSWDNPPGMSGSAAAVIHNALYLFGGYGYNGEGCTNKLFKLDLETFSWENLTPTGISPSPVDKMVGWHYDNKFYIFGGFGNNENSLSQGFQFVYYNLFHVSQRGWTNQFFEYDPETNHWSKPSFTGDLPSARAAHAAAVLQDKVYIFGGRHDSHRLNDLHYCDMKTMHWSGPISVKGPVPEGRSWHSLTALSNRFLILYGGFSQTNVALSDCWMFDTTSDSWQQIELPYKKPRLWHTACQNLFGEVLIYGGCMSNIFDHETKSAPADDIIVINIAPKSLFRICLDKVSLLRMLRPLWSILPLSIQTALHHKVGSYITSNLDGS